MNLTLDRIVKNLKGKKPRDEEEVLKYCKFPLHYLEEGAFRAAYSIVGTPYILKIPVKHCYEGSASIPQINHGRIEFRTYKRIMKSKRKYKELQPYMPKIYYFNGYTGLTLMHRYELLQGSNSHTLRTEMHHVFCEVLGHSDPDICNRGNVAKDEHGNLILIDLGMLEEQDW